MRRPRRWGRWTERVGFIQGPTIPSAGNSHLAALPRARGLRDADFDSGLTPSRQTRCRHASGTFENNGAPSPPHETNPPLFRAILAVSMPSWQPRSCENEGRRWTPQRTRTAVRCGNTVHDSAQGLGGVVPRARSGAACDGTAGGVARLRKVIAVKCRRRRRPSRWPSPRSRSRHPAGTVWYFLGPAHGRRYGGGEHAAPAGDHPDHARPRRSAACYSARNRRHGCASAGNRAWVIRVGGIRRVMVRRFR